MRLVDKDGNHITNEQTKAKALGKAINAMTMHAFMTDAKLDEKMNKIPKHLIDAHIVDFRQAIDDDPNITLYVAFGLYLAINKEEDHGISQDLMDTAFNKFMSILNKIKM